MLVALKLWILFILGFLAFGGDHPPEGLILLLIPMMWPPLLFVMFAPFAVFWLIRSLWRSLVPRKHGRWLPAE